MYRTRHAGGTRAAVVAAAALVLAAGMSAVSGAERTVAAARCRIHPPDRERAQVEAFFAARSYMPGDTARLRLHAPGPALCLEILRAGLEPATARLPGVPVTAARAVPTGARRVRVEVGDWRSGLYFARLERAGAVGYAPFVVRPRRPSARVAVVLPTNTWQAYNFRDQDGDGVGDTWYADPARDVVQTDRAYQGHGVPPHYRHYDRGFLRWLVLRRHAADVLAQEDVERTTGAALRRAYELIVFPGHHEYVTEHEFDVIEAYRDLGGNLAFLSANNFFWRVHRRGETLVRDSHWRTLGRPEAALVGVQYVDWNSDALPMKPYRLVRAHRVSWLFHGTGLHNGDAFAKGGIEIDRRCAASPPGTLAIAVIPDALGHGKTAEMGYYETSNGARVLAAGAFTLAGAALWPEVSRVLDNAWHELSRRHDVAH